MDSKMVTPSSASRWVGITLPVKPKGLMLAASAATRPKGLSSMTAHLWGSTPMRAAAWRKRSGAAVTGAAVTGGAVTGGAA